jgi:hypothetical protein
MGRYQIGSAVFLLFVGSFFAIEARTLKIGKIVKPEPGFFPFWLGIGLIILSLALIFQSMRGRINSGAAQPLWKGLRWQKGSRGRILLDATQRAWIKVLETEGELARVTTEVDWNLEIAAMTYQKIINKALLPYPYL